MASKPEIVVKISVAGFHARFREIFWNFKALQTNVENVLLLVYINNTHIDMYNNNWRRVLALC
jgi:hypothetical protein